MTYVVPREVQSARAQTINGVVYTQGQVLTGAQVKAIPHLSALLSAGYLTAVPDVHSRKAVKGNRTPTNIPPVALAVVGATDDMDVSSVVVVGHHVAFTVLKGDPPFSIDWDDASADTVTAGRTAEHLYAAQGTYHVVVTGENADTEPETVVVNADFTVADDSSAGLVAAFTATNGQTPYSVDWGDGTVNALLTHTYTVADDYTVEVTDAFGQVDTLAVVAVSVPKAPTTVAGTDKADGTADLSWVAPVDFGNSAITGYKVEKSSTPYSSWTQVTASTGDADLTYNAALGAGTWKVRVSAINAVGTGAASAASAGITVTGP